MNRTVAHQYLEEVRGVIIGDVEPPKVCAILYRWEDKDIPRDEKPWIWRKDGFANDAEARAAAGAQVEKIKAIHGHEYKTKYPQGFELQLHTY